MHLKFEEKPFKLDASKQHVFGFEFWKIFLVWASENEGKMSNFRTLIENANSAKIIFSLRKIAIFLVRSLQNSMEIRRSNALKNNVKKKNLRFPTFVFTIAVVIERKKLSLEARKQTRASESLKMTSHK